MSDHGLHECQCCSSWLQTHKAVCAELEHYKNNLPDVSKMAKDLDAALKHLQKVCAPEPDGFGSFVADEFTEPAVLDARKFLSRFPLGVEGDKK